MSKHFLEYSNTTNLNVIKKEEFQGLVGEVFGLVSSHLSHSLGPMGSTTTIMNGARTSATKDGFAILKSMYFNNIHKTMAMNLIRTPCTILNNTVGDGTTTSIALANALYQLHDAPMPDQKIETDEAGNTKPYMSYKAYIDRKHRMPRELTQGWDDVVEKMQEKIKSYATPLDTSDFDSVYNICHVTSNGNDQLSRDIAEIYANSESPYIIAKDSPERHSYVSPVKGFNINANLIDVRYASNSDMTHNQEEAHVMIFDHKITTDIISNVIIPVQHFMSANNTALIIVAPMYDEIALTDIWEYIAIQSRQGKGILLYLMQYSKLVDHQLSDFSVICNSYIITQKVCNDLTEQFKSASEGVIGDLVNKHTVFDYNGDPNYIGKVYNSILACEGESIFKTADMTDNDRYKNLIMEANNELEAIRTSMTHSHQKYSHNLYKTRERIARIKMENYIYYVGAETDLEQGILRDSVDDVIKCVRSATKYGTVPGCQLSLMRAAGEVSDDYLEPYKATEEDDPSKVRIQNGYVMDKIPEDILLKIFLAGMVDEAAQTVYTQVLEGPERTGLVKLIKDWATAGLSIEQIRESRSKLRNSIIKESIDTFTTYDMTTATHSNNILTSAETDIMVLSTSIQLIKILTSGNQCLFVDAELNNTHQENTANLLH